jgi:biopolymer transport protein ExbB
MSNNNVKSAKGSFNGLLTAGAIFLSVCLGYIVWKYIMGSPANFENGNPAGNPLPGNLLAVIYKGGFIVPFLIGANLTVIIFAVERLISISRAKGKGKLTKFVRNIQEMLRNDQIEDAIVACDKQRGSLANVMKAGLVRFRDLQSDTKLLKDQKIAALQKELEEASALEMPMLSKNLVILSTIASISVLIGLMGTVIGMIKAFAALATAGSPDALALATGISEALINTAFGIFGSLLAIVMYNIFSTQVDGYTFKMDEAGFSVVQTFVSSEKTK